MADNEGRLVSDEVRARLIGAARERGFVNYKELVIIMGHENPKRGDYSPLWPLLDAITKDELRDGRPMLCSVAIKTGKTYPGIGFYRLACGLKFVQTANEDRDFWRVKLEETWDYWSNLRKAS